MITPIKRPPEELEQHKIVKQRIEESIKRDINLTSKRNLSKFQNKQDVINRLLPYHVHYIPKSKPIELKSDDVILKDAADTIHRAKEIMKTEQKVGGFN